MPTSLLTTYHDNGGSVYGYKAANTAKCFAVDQPHSSMPAAEAAWEASVPEAVPETAVRSVALLCLGTAVAYGTPCRR